MSSYSLEVWGKGKVLRVAGIISYSSDFYYLIYNHFALLFLFTAILKSLGQSSGSYQSPSKPCFAQAG